MAKKYAETEMDPHEISRYFYERMTGKSYDGYVAMLKDKGFAVEYAGGQRQ